MDEMHSDTNKCDSIISEAVKREITVPLETFQSQMVSHTESIADLECFELVLVR